MKKHLLSLFGLGLLVLAAMPAWAQKPVNKTPKNPEDLEINRQFRKQVLEGMIERNETGVREPMLSRINGKDMFISHTKQIVDGQLANLLVEQVADAIGAISSTGHEIKSVKGPQRDLFGAAVRLGRSAEQGIVDNDAAEEILDILLGRTEGKIYDGFGLLNFNRFNSADVPTKAYTPGTVPGEYKMKTLRYTGEQELSWKGDGNLVNVWEIDVNMLWYGQQFDSDTFLVKIPYQDPESGLHPDWNDTLRVNYTIYSLVEEDFAPTTVMLDAQVLVDGEEGSVRFPYKGLDTVWRRVNPQTVHKMTIQHPPLRFIRGVYIWGWNVHPPRIQFMQPIQEVLNHRGEVQLEPQGQSFQIRNRELSLEGISDYAPEKRLYNLAKAVVDGSLSPNDILSELGQDEIGSYANLSEWVATMTDQRELPPVVREKLAAEGKDPYDYDFVTVYMNNEMYGNGPLAHTIRPWSQGEHMTVRMFNLDNHTHYFRNVGFGTQLDNDLASNQEAEDAIFSFEVMNFKPLYGAPKVAEMQWRAGWGFRPHYSVVQQDDVFPRESDQRNLAPFIAPDLKTGEMQVYWGYQYSEEFRGGDFPFNPPRFIVKSVGDEAFETLYDFGANRSWWTRYEGAFVDVARRNWTWWKEYLGHTFDSGLVIGQHTEGFGTQKMCPDSPFPGFCEDDFSAAHWRGKKNWPAPNDPSVPKTQLRFPPFLRNPDQIGLNAGDIIPPTPTWKPFLWINPRNGTIYNDPDDPSKGYWADFTYSHGAPLFAGEDKVITIEMPRSAAQLFYQFDDLFHDNAIFSPHPIE